MLLTMAEKDVEFAILLPPHVQDLGAAALSHLAKPDLSITDAIVVGSTVELFFFKKKGYYTKKMHLILEKRTCLVPPHCT